MALEVRLRDRAQLTKDSDLGLRDGIAGGSELQERLVEALSADPFGDRFTLAPGPVAKLTPDGGGHLTWRSNVSATLAGRPFGGLKLDVSPRAHELDCTDVVTLPNSLAFAGIAVPAVDVIDVNRHAAEKLHAMTRDFGERENSRVRDLLDLGSWSRTSCSTATRCRTPFARSGGSVTARLLPARSRSFPRAGPSATSTWPPSTTSMPDRFPRRWTSRRRCGRTSTCGRPDDGSSQEARRADLAAVIKTACATPCARTRA